MDDAQEFERQHMVSLIPPGRAFFIIKMTKQIDKVKIGTINVRGLKRAPKRNGILKQAKLHTDILCIQETWADDKNDFGYTKRLAW